MKKLFSNSAVLLCLLAFCTTLVFTSCQKEMDAMRYIPSETLHEKVTATSATITGKLNLSTSDLAFAEVKIYYSDAPVLHVNNAKVVSTSCFEEDKSFTIFLPALKVNTKYNYCLAVVLRSEEIFGDVRSFTTAEVTIGDFVAYPEYFGAEIVGVMPNFYNDIGVFIGIEYSNIRMALENGAGSKEYISDVSSEGEVRLTLKDLNHRTNYYFRAFAYYDGNYNYGPIQSFTTMEHPYLKYHSLDPASAVDLSETSSANSYIVSQSGLYKFKAVKGNSSESLNFVPNVSIIWETFGTTTVPEYLDLIKAVSYTDGYILFQTADTYKEGNALIAAMDSKGNILWSWHIWLTDYPEGQEYFNGAGIMMDRNLGATASTSGDSGSHGLLYQWGRKDPFMGSCLPNGEVKATAEFTTRESSLIDGTIEYAISHPTTFITNSNDWMDYPRDMTRWTTSDKKKSIYDPCPAGWRVPDGGEKGVWSKALGSSEVIQNHTHDGSYGINFSGLTGSSSSIWYPSCGFRDGNDAKLNTVGYAASYWSASPYDAVSEHNVVLFIQSQLKWSYIHPNRIHFPSADAMSVRCIRE